jgi:UDPglucose 6-dehydrogenase
MKITVVGTGYVGLVSGTCLAEVGNDVLCLDVDPAKIRILEEGGIPIYEPGLQEMVRRNVAAGRLHFTTDIEKAVAARHHPVHRRRHPARRRRLGRPPVRARRCPQHRPPDDRLQGCRRQSTVPVGTAAKVKAAIADELAKRASTSLQRRFQPGIPQGRRRRRRLHAPDRIVVGAEEEQAIHLMRALYAPFQRNHERLIVTDVKSAELTKYAANAMLATRISFMNELANLAEVLGADIEMVARASAPTRASATTSSTPAAATAVPASPKTSRP